MSTTRTARRAPLVAALLIATALAILAAVAFRSVPAGAATARPATVHPVPDAKPFCYSLAVFGDRPTYSNFVQFNDSADNVIGKVRADFTSWRFALLAGYPRTVIRARSAQLWKDCGR